MPAFDRSAIVCPGILLSYLTSLVELRSLSMERPRKSITNFLRVKRFSQAEFLRQILIDSCRSVCYKSCPANTIHFMVRAKRSSMRLPMVAALILTIAAVASGQSKGTITGTIKPPAGDIVVIATNQVTSKVARARVDSHGEYSFSVRPGAYR